MRVIESVEKNEREKAQRFLDTQVEQMEAAGGDSGNPLFGRATAGTLGVVVLGERLTPLALTGVGLLLCGLVLASVGGKRGPESSF